MLRWGAMRRRGAKCADVYLRNHCARAQRAGAAQLVHPYHHILSWEIYSVLTGAQQYIPCFSYTLQSK